MSLSQSAPPTTRGAVRNRPPRPSRADSPARRDPAQRDPAVDVARAACLVVVVLLHALMVGVGTGPDGPVLENAMERWPGFAALSWVVQVMPLFFLLGGFSAHTQWTRMRERGASAGAYLAGRVRRLFLPAAAALAAVATLLSALTLAGVPAEPVGVAGFRISQPLWFLGVYVLCTLAVPPLVALHRRSPLAGLLLPAALAVAVDVVRGATGITGIGFANLLFVWLTVQQLGFWLADGRFDGLSRRQLGAIAAGALGALGVLCGVGVWSFDMLANLNPPTCALLLLALAQLAAFRLLAPAARSAARHRPVAQMVGWVSARAMTVYLWHMPVLVLLAGGLLLTGAELPEPLGAAWWASRPAWLAAVLIAVAGVVTLAGRVETARVHTLPAVGTGRGVVAAAAGAAGIVVALLVGASPAAWVVATALALLALRILHGSAISAALTR